MLERLLDIAEANGVDAQIVDGLDDAATGISLLLSIPWTDLSGDGLGDVLVVEIDAVDAALLWTGTLRLTARAGTNGRKLWSETVRFTNGLAFPTLGRVGKSGRHGVIVLKIEDLSFGFVGLSNKGKKIYAHDEALYEEDEIPLLADRRLVNFGLFDAIEGKATDILFGTARVSTFGITGVGTVNETEVTILDGRDGALATHVHPELSIGSPPVPFPGPDIDRDGLDDYVVTGVLPEPSVDGQSGLPEPTDLQADYVRGRRGSDGASLWTSDPLPLSGGASTSVGPLVLDEGAFVLAGDAGDMTADRTSDVLIEVQGFGDSELDRSIHVVDGATGLLSWSGSGGIAAAVPDIDRDGKRDVFSVAAIHRGKRVTMRLDAYSGRAGDRLYRRNYRLKGTSEEGGTFLVVIRMGDVDPDGLPEFFLRLGWSDGHGTTRSMEMIVNVGNGKKHQLRLRGDEWISGPVDGRGDDVIRSLGPGVSVFDGKSRRELLSLFLTPPGTPFLDTSYFLSVAAAPIDRDRCADLVGTFADGRSYFTVVMDGGSGALRWSTKERGPLPGFPQVGARKDGNPAC